MARSSEPYELRRLPLERLPQAEMLRVYARRPVMYGLFESDVTRARELIRQEGARTGRRLSFTAYLISLFARAVDEHRSVQAFRRGRRGLVVFDEVDVATLIEVEAAAGPAPLFHVVRDAAHKSPAEIHDEIRAAQAAKADIGARRRQIRRMGLVPRPLRTLAWRALPRAPATWKRHGGTVVLTSIGMFGAGSGWGLSTPGGYPVSLTVGGIGRRPAIVDGTLQEREVLSLTLAFDHEVVDGAPAARLGARLKALIEEAHGLPEPVDGGSGSEQVAEGERARS